MRTVGLISKKKTGSANGANGQKPPTKAEIMEKLTALGVEFDKNARVGELADLLKEAEEKAAAGNGTPGEGSEDKE